MLIEGTGAQSVEYIQMYEILFLVEYDLPSCSYLCMQEDSILYICLYMGPNYMQQCQHIGAIFDFEVVPKAREYRKPNNLDNTYRSI